MIKNIFFICLCFYFFIQRIIKNSFYLYGYAFLFLFDYFCCFEMLESTDSHSGSEYVDMSPMKEEEPKNTNSMFILVYLQGRFLTFCELPLRDKSICVCLLV